jgi:hypothetical protein
MVHCGYEPSAVAATFGSLRGLLRTAYRTLYRLPMVPEESSAESPAVVGKVPLDVATVDRMPTRPKTRELVQITSS